MDDDEGGDEPVMLDESGNEVSREDVERMAKTEAEDTAQLEVVRGSVVEGGEMGKVSEGKRADGGVSSGFGRKRKVVRVVGDEGGEQPRRPEDGEEGVGAEPVKSIGESTKDLRSAVEQNKEGVKKAAESGTATRKGKRKKVKLSFDEPE